MLLTTQAKASRRTRMEDDFRYSDDAYELAGGQSGSTRADEDKRTSDRTKMRMEINQTVSILCHYR